MSSSQEFPPGSLDAGPHQAPQTEALLRRVADLIAQARPMPLSASAMINKEEILELLEEAIARIPDELRAARWLLKEREEFLARVRREGDEVLDQARAEAGRMVQRSEVAKAAEQHARKIVEQAEADARRMRHEVEDFCDQKLGSFEIVLERIQRMVGAGRDKLQASARVGDDEDLSLEPGLDGEVVEPGDLSGAFFDQDQE